MFQIETKKIISNRNINFILNIGKNVKKLHSILNFPLVLAKDLIFKHQISNYGNEYKDFLESCHKLLT